MKEKGPSARAARRGLSGSDASPRRSYSCFAPTLHAVVPDRAVDQIDRRAAVRSTRDVVLDADVAGLDAQFCRDACLARVDELLDWAVDPVDFK